MVEEGIISMSVEEIRRVGIIQKVIGRELKQVKAAEVIGVSDRQVRRIVKRVKVEGIKGVIHRSRNKRGNHCIEDKVKAKVLKLYNNKYPDFGPLLASEKLEERDEIKIDHETLRRWLLKEQDSREWRRRKRPHREWRERKECIGEMIQMDGSDHDWLEGRGEELVLMGYVDDATGRVFGRFYQYEGKIPAFDSVYKYIEKYGLPQSIYLDRHSTYKTTRKQTTEEELMNEIALTQFERAMKELGIQVIHAYSAPAKGRVENLFGTFQDRLIKEMRLAGIKDIEGANKFLEEYLPVYNRRFNVAPKLNTDLHRSSPGKEKLDSILCTKEERIVRKDSTIRYKNKYYLLTGIGTKTVKKVTVEERLDGSIHVNHKGEYLQYKEIEPSIKISISQDKPIRSKKRYMPGKNHLWRKWCLVKRKEEVLAEIP